MTGPIVLPARDPGAYDDVASRLVPHLEDGGIVAHPTETVYGLGGLVVGQALDRLATLKGRDPSKPFLLLVEDEGAVPELAWADAGRRLARSFWPGPLTLVMADPRGVFPPLVRGPAGTVAVRATSHPLARGLLRALKRPITSTSANRPGEEAAATGKEALGVVRELGGGSDVWVVDAGTLPPSPPSTIVDCTEEPPVVIRAGAVAVDELRRALPGIRRGVAEVEDDAVKRRAVPREEEPTTEANG